MRPPGGEVVLLAIDEFVERARPDHSVVVRECHDDRRVEQRLPPIERRPGVEVDVVGHELIDGGACRVGGGIRGVGRGRGSGKSRKA